MSGWSRSSLAPFSTTPPSFSKTADRLGGQMTIELKLATPLPGSESTQREHLKVAVPNHPWLQPFEMSAFELYIMAVFWQLSRDRQVEGMTGMPRGFSLQSFVFYQQLFDDVLNTDEIELLQHLDSVYLNAITELRKDNNG